MKKFIVAAILAAGVLCLLQGCIFAVGAAAGAAGIAVVYDHRKIEQMAQDQTIANSIAEQIDRSPRLRDNTHINVTSFNRIVLLTGEATSPELRQDAVNIASNVKGVLRVYNQINIKGPTSSLSRASDTWITTKIKSTMVATQNLSSSSIKVVTENGTVYLMGCVTREQANIAVSIAREATGVQRVVRVFQYRN